MKPLAIALTLLVLLAYAALAAVDPATGVLHPRGGIVTLGISLALANAAIAAAGHDHRTPSMRFQLAAAGWIWLLVQLGGIAWLYVHATAA